MSVAFSFHEFEHLDFDVPNISKDVCLKLVSIEKIMSENE
jgi:hypothetical protein